MSVFGGDSWGREAQYRKRRVDDLLLDAAGDHSSYLKLRSGKYACVVCPHNPILDTPLMLSMHMKTSRHCAAETKLKQREQEQQTEMNKRMAFTQDCTSMTKTGSKPWIEKTRNDVFEVIQQRTHEQNTPTNAKNVKFSQPVCKNEPHDSTNQNSVQMDYRERRERELKFIAAGWKRDCHGGWFRDENVEFDSDEEDPNVSLASGE